MIDRIKENEKRLDNVLLSIKKLDEALNDFEINKKNIKILNKYYGSKTWFKDKDLLESGKIENIKAGVLGEDTIWDLLENIDLLIAKMKKIIKDYD
jgi:hypothetical protein